ncbi:MAG: hypothetical protein M3552_19595, partial [Planctomycetota bacterium]|nr:hypothetical protein [Planctomycetota bacterium]
PFVDSDVWFAEAVRRRERTRQPPPRAVKPQGSLSGDEINYWLKEFADAQETEEPPKAGKRKKPSSKSGGEGDLSNPFPPGYGEDLLNEG